MARAHRLNLLVVDGSQVLRLSVPRWALYGGSVGLALLVFALGVISAERFLLKHQGAQVDALQRQVAEQQLLIDASHRRLTHVRSEVSTWRQLHAEMWEPFGPNAGPARKATTGVGGGASDVAPVARVDALVLSQELDRLSSTVKEEGQSLRALAGLIGKARRVLVSLPYRWPVEGAVNSNFGRRTSPWTGKTEFHSGIDIDADRGTQVKAPAPGVVQFAGRGGAYGITVILDHGNQIQSLYGHLEKLQVAKGQRVERGQVIAVSGSTGRSSGPHLHYEVLVKGQPVNPRGFLWEN